MANDAKAVANEFLELAKRDNCPITPMQLQKLVYFAHGWHLALKNNPLLDEVIEAWDYGPVVASLYREFKEFGATEITRLARDFDAVTMKIVVPTLPCDSNGIFAKKLVERVWDIYKSYTGTQLSNLTHENDSPWTITVKHANEQYGFVPKHLDINNDLIRDYFRSQIKE